VKKEACAASKWQIKNKCPVLYEKRVWILLGVWGRVGERLFGEALVHNVITRQPKIQSFMPLKTGWIIMPHYAK
jgi:hypothetical protein